ncbi:MAG: hypothetical protein GSR78_00710 [Desulfurococcales archaeon]|nr:hypothetical protein [Desulfurococcales archaeon]
MDPLLAWALGLILPEILGMGAARLAVGHGMGEAYSMGLAVAVISVSRLVVVALLAERLGVDLAGITYKPVPGGSQAIILLALALATAVLDYIVSKWSNGGVYQPQLAEYRYYHMHGVVYMYPFQVAYYVTEVIALNLMYITARNTWTILGDPIIAGLAFVIIFWALPHALTKNLGVALYASLLALVLYSGYEATGSPLTPLLLWLIVVLV